MGGSASRVTWRENEASPLEPSQKSVLSDPLDSIEFSDEAFWKHLGALKREAIPLPMFAKALGVHIAKHEVTDREDGTFLVTTTIGGYYGGEVDVNFVHSYDPETNTWTQKCDRDPGLQKVNNQVKFRLHSSPRLIEMWCVNDEARNSGPEVAAGLHAVTGGILKDLAGQDAPPEFEVKADQPSKDGSGKLCAQTAPLDAFISSVEKFMEQAIDGAKKGKGAVTHVEFVVLEDNGDNFKVKEVTDPEGNGQHKVSYVHHVYDKASGTVMAHIYKEDNFATKIATFVTKVYASPFVVEQYIESHAVRHAGADVVKAVGPQVETVLSKAVEEGK